MAVYNLNRRPLSIYLIETFRISAGNLFTAGYGKTKPKDPNAPVDPANRRVQVINMVNKTASN